MKILGNIIWLIFGGLGIALEYFASPLVLMIIVIGIPSGIATVKLGILALWPFGSHVVDRPQGSSCVDVFMNMLQFFIRDIWIALTHLGFDLLLGIATVGIPWAKMHFCLMHLALTPFEEQIVNGDFQARGSLGRPIAQMNGARHKRKTRYRVLIVHNHLG